MSPSGKSHNSRPYAHGTYARVAARLGVTKTAVRLVAIGTSKSARIQRELAREARNAKRRAAHAAERQRKQGAAFGLSNSAEPRNGGGRQD